MSTRPLQLQTLKISEIIPYWRNPRVNEAAVEAVRQSIERYGYTVPIIVDKEYTIISGHTRYKALLRLGVQDVAVIVSSMTAERAKEFRIVDNKTSEHAEWDMDKLVAELREIPEVAELQPFFKDVAISAFLSEAGGFNTNTPTAQEIQDQASALAVQYQQQEGMGFMTITCPHCATEFMLDRAELLRRTTTERIDQGKANETA